jgi:hypothetical protein
MCITGRMTAFSRHLSSSEVCLLRQDQGIIYLDPEISHGAFQLGMAEQELAGAEVARALVQQCDLRPRRLWVP